MNHHERANVSDPPDLNRHQGIIVGYQDRIGDFEADIAQLLQRWKSLSIVRGVTFLTALALVIMGFASYLEQRNLWFYLSGFIFLGFLVVAYVHEGIESRRRKKLIWLRLNRWSLARLQRDWGKLKQPDIKISPDVAAVNRDLDLFGRSSLFQLIGGVETPLGIELIKQWIFGGPNAIEIKNRQESVRELSDKKEFRNQLRFLCHLLADGDSGPDKLTEWAESPKLFDQSGGLIWLARLFAALMLGGILLVIFRIIPLTIGGPFVIAVFAVNFLLTVIFSARIHTQFNQVATRHGEISHYSDVFRLVRNESTSSSLLGKLKAELFDPDADVLVAKNSLGKIAWMANLRRHGFLFIIYLVLQFLFLWDFHVIHRLEIWKKQYGRHVRQWFHNLGHWEVLAAISQFAEDHPEWAFPVVNVSPKLEVTIVAMRLGHPLLQQNECVCNDVQVGPSGTVLLVTGSNMSGKSTLLRAIGSNVVLARLGAPVCANSMTLSPLRIETSMRISDSLEDGVSFFMAELKRLKEIVDIAANYEQDDEQTVLFLLDEILQGTNSRERHIAVTRVIRHLIDHRAIGAVSTHDLELGKTPELAEACCAVHFRESFAEVDGRKQMTFDYQMHKGIATTTNALELLKLVGLDEMN